MASKKVFAFGCEDAAILDAGAVPVYTDIPGIKEAEFTCEVDEKAVEGDDDELTIWYHSPKASLKLKNAVIDLDILAKITGNTVIGDSDSYAIPIGTDAELNPPTVGLRLMLKAKDASTGVAKKFYVYIYKVVFSPPKLEGFKKGEELIQNLEAKAFKSTTDEFANALSPAARARIEIVDI